MTAAEQDAAIRAAFYDEETTIGKLQSLLLPQDQTLGHVATPLIRAYANQGCPQFMVQIQVKITLKMSSSRGHMLLP